MTDENQGCADVQHLTLVVMGCSPDPVLTRDSQHSAACRQCRCGARIIHMPGCTQPDGWEEGTEAANHPVNCGCSACRLGQIDTLQQEVHRLQNLLLAADTTESLQALVDRDEYHEWADRLAAAIAGEDEIGEHSSANNPWANALHLAASQRERIARYQAVAAAARHPHKGPNDTDASMLVEAATRAEAGYPVGGQHTQAMVGRVLRALAVALGDDAESADGTPGQPETSYDSEDDLPPRNAGLWRPVAEPTPVPAKLCDDDGVVRGGPMHHGTDYPCTGSAHLAGDVYRCTTAIHGEPLAAWAQQTSPATVTPLEEMLAADEATERASRNERAVLAVLKLLDRVQELGDQINRPAPPGTVRAQVRAEAVRAAIAAALGGPPVKCPVGPTFAEAFRINYAHGPEFGWECVPCGIEHLNGGTAGAMERAAAEHNAAEHPTRHMDTDQVFGIMRDALAGAKQQAAPRFDEALFGQPAGTQDCRSEDGETVGLLDAALTVLRFAGRRDLISSTAVREAIADLWQDPEVREVLTAPSGSGTPATVEDRIVQAALGGVDWDQIGPPGQAMASPRDAAQHVAVTVIRALNNHAASPEPER